MGESGFLLEVSSFINQFIVRTSKIMERESWKSRLGFVFAAVGSAVGLANIWKFPYIVGQNGGAAFIAVYLICLLLIGFPVLVAEIMLGRKTRKNPYGALSQVGSGPMSKIAGGMILLTGFVVSSFYSVVAGWILGYVAEAALGNLSYFGDLDASSRHFSGLVGSAWWTLSFHALFMFICVIVLSGGVRKGIEKGTTYLMPILMVVLVGLVIKGLSLPNASEGLRFLLSPNWSLLTPAAIITALGHSFFTLSLGQGTMITYGSYLPEDENIPKSCLPIALLDTLVSLMMAVAVFTIAFSAGMEPDAGPALIFHTLPYVFGQIPGGYLAAIFFFLLVVLAALTSEISAMEPMIAYLSDEKGWARKKAVCVTGLFAFLFGIPSALSMGLLSEYTLFGMTFLEAADFLCTSVLIPIGGFVAVVTIGWGWGKEIALEHLKKGASDLFQRYGWLDNYFWFCFKYSAPFLIVFVFLQALGVL
ncbi:MAG: NSS family neurotransmitter:Na+ symporter [Chlamydiales bacterium]